MIRFVSTTLLLVALLGASLWLVAQVESAEERAALAARRPAPAERVPERRTTSAIDARRAALSAPQGSDLERGPAARAVPAAGPTVVAAEVEVEPDAPRTAVLRGAVRFAGGEPVPGAVVTVLSAAEPTAPVTCRAGPDGSFEAAEVPAGPAAIAAEAAGTPRSDPLSVELAPGEVREGLELVLARGARLTGEVLATVPDRVGRRVLASRVDRYEFHDALVDAEGRFELVLEPGAYRVMLDWRPGGGGPEDFVEAYATRFEERCVVAADADSHVVLGRHPENAVEVSGVVAEDTRPVPSLLVYAWSAQDSQPATMARTDADGRYALVLPAPGSWRLTVGETQTRQVPFEVLVPAVRAHVLDLALPSAALAGEVRGPDGTGVPGASLLLTEASAPFGTRDLGRVRSARTDDEGRWSIDRLPAGRWRLRVGGVGDGFEDARLGVAILEDVVVLEHAAQAGVDVDLALGASLPVRVVDHDGQPVAGAAVEVLDGEGRPVWVWTTRLRTDSAGRVRVTGIPPGAATVRAASGERRGEAVLELLPGEARTLTLVLR